MFYGSAVSLFYDSCRALVSAAAALMLAVTFAVASRYAAARGRFMKIVIIIFSTVSSPLAVSLRLPAIVAASQLAGEQHPTDIS